MALIAYQVATLRLLNDTYPTPSLYSLPQITDNINSARLQLAGDAECIRQFAFITTVAGVRGYSVNNATFDPLAIHGLGGILNIRDIGRSMPGGIGVVKLYGRAWEWFSAYYVQKAVANSGIPTRWAMFVPGPAGAFLVDPIPDGAYQLGLDVVCLPIPLVDDTTAEAIPDPWTPAIKYYAAYLSFLDQMRAADADAMLGRYWQHAKRGTQTTTPTQLPDNFPGGAGAQQAQGRGLVSGPAERAQR